MTLTNQVVRPDHDLGKGICEGSALISFQTAETRGNWLSLLRFSVKLRIVKFVFHRLIWITKIYLAILTQNRISQDRTYEM